MKIKIFMDGANLQEMLEGYRKGGISGFTTNPTLMRKAGVTNYEAFAREALSSIKDLPISFEVFSDELALMERQARKIASWGNNVYVKMPVTNTKGMPTTPIIKTLSEDRIKLNVTAVFTLDQVKGIAEALSSKTPSVISVFAGRIANTGMDPVPHMKEAVKLVKRLPLCEILWASPREALNIVQAEECGCHIITVTSDILAAIKNFNKDLAQYSMETVQMFYRDAASAGYTL